MFTPIGLKTTKPLENQEVSFCFSDPAGINVCKLSANHSLSLRISMKNDAPKHAPNKSIQKSADH